MVNWKKKKKKFENKDLSLIGRIQKFFFIYDLCDIV